MRGATNAHRDLVATREAVTRILDGRLLEQAARACDDMADGPPVRNGETSRSSDSTSSTERAALAGRPDVGRETWSRIRRLTRDLAESAATLEREAHGIRYRAPTEADVRLADAGRALCAEFVRAGRRSAGMFADLESDLGGLLPAPVPMCRWAHDVQIDLGRRLSKDELRAAIEARSKGSIEFPRGDGSKTRYPTP